MVVAEVWSAMKYPKRSQYKHAKQKKYHVRNWAEYNDGLRRWGERSRRLGFRGMGCLHPRQIAPIHEAYDPTPAEIERALRIVAAFEAAQAAGLGVVSLGSKMIDPPVVKRALRLVDEAVASGLLDADWRDRETGPPES